MKTPIELYVIAQVTRMRMERGISQGTLAGMLGMSRGFIGQIECPGSVAKYNINHLYALAKLFDCSVREFFPEKNDL